MANFLISLFYTVLFAFHKYNFFFFLEGKHIKKIQINGLRFLLSAVLLNFLISILLGS